MPSNLSTPRMSGSKSLYQVLGVWNSATKSEIKVAFQRLLLANQSGSLTGEDWKQVLEAYWVLGDDYKRLIYDQNGTAELAVADCAIAAVCEEMFGEGQFDDFFGDLEFPHIFFPDQVDHRGFSISDPILGFTEKYAELEKRVERRAKRLVPQLKAKLDLIANASDKQKVLTQIRQEVEELLTISGGPSILKKIGYVYSQEGTQHRSQLGNVLAVFSHCQEAAHSFILSSQVSSELQSWAEKVLAKSEQQQVELFNAGIELLLKLGRIEIEMICHQVCVELLEKSSLPRAQFKAYTHALQELGDVYFQSGDAAKRKSTNPTGMYRGFSKCGAR